MNPLHDLVRTVTMPLRALFVVGLCGLINAMTYSGTWWFKWVALGMGIATVLVGQRAARAGGAGAAGGCRVVDLPPLRRYRPQRLR